MLVGGGDGSVAAEAARGACGSGGATESEEESGTACLGYTARVVGSGGYRTVVSCPQET
jgi:hypothetical protein